MCHRWGYLDDLVETYELGTADAGYSRAIDYGLGIYYHSVQTGLAERHSERLAEELLEQVAEEALSS
jgi:hypothetical protein